MSTELKEPTVKPLVWDRPHLLELEDLSKEELEAILQRTEELREFSICAKKSSYFGR